MTPKLFLPAYVLAGRPTRIEKDSRRIVMGGDRQKAKVNAIERVLRLGKLTVSMKLRVR